MKTSMRTKRIALVLALALLGALLAVGAASAAPGGAGWRPSWSDPTIGNTAKLRKAVEPTSILKHERRFQRIADANDKTRA